MNGFLLIVHLFSPAAALGISITLFVLGLHATTLPPDDAGALPGRVTVAAAALAAVFAVFAFR